MQNLRGGLNKIIEELRRSKYISDKNSNGYIVTVTPVTTKFYYRIKKWKKKCSIHVTREELNEIINKQEVETAKELDEEGQEVKKDFSVMPIVKHEQIEFAEEMIIEERSESEEEKTESEKDNNESEDVSIGDETDSRDLTNLNDAIYETLTRELSEEKDEAADKSRADIIENDCESVYEDIFTSTKIKKENEVEIIKVINKQVPSEETPTTSSAVQDRTRTSIRNLILGSHTTAMTPNQARTLHQPPQAPSTSTHPMTNAATTTQILEISVPIRAAPRAPQIGSTRDEGARLGAQPGGQRITPTKIMNSLMKTKLRGTCLEQDFWGPYLNLKHFEFTTFKNQRGENLCRACTTLESIPVLTHTVKADMEICVMTCAGCTRQMIFHPVLGKDCERCAVEFATSILNCNECYKKFAVIFN